jgi:hypothetical protein
MFREERIEEGREDGMASTVRRSWKLGISPHKNLKFFLCNLLTYIFRFIIVGGDGICKECRSLALASLVDHLLA